MSRGAGGGAGEQEEEQGNRRRSSEFCKEVTTRQSEIMLPSLVFKEQNKGSLP